MPFLQKYKQKSFSLKKSKSIEEVRGMTVIKSWQIGGVIVGSFFVSVALAQTCNSNILTMMPNHHFTVHNDGTVTHKTTGLMWKVCSEGQAWQLNLGTGTASCSGVATNYSWSAALQVPQSLNLGGGFPLSGGSTIYTDWRLPNLKELKSIAELQCYSPAINEVIFPNTDSTWYCTSSPSASNSSNVWRVNFENGSDSNIFNRSFISRVRLVRSGL